MPVRHRTLASFGGITRIRFKGSVASATLSAMRLPRIFYFVQNKTRLWEVNVCAPYFGRTAHVVNRVGVPAAKLLMKTYPPAGACFTFV